ncbi:hypothetical protein GCM10023329_58560 [Streptomyces sanyensis]|uniref:Uncharacterized protein n=1 Tax=Streptomyces sanyensis TaxID=568869 RepID=A0ABP9BQ20_9ACTN
MYNSLSEPDPLKIYIQNNCLHLISLQRFMSKAVNLQKGLQEYRVDSSGKQGHPSLYKGKAGCYVLLCLSTGSFI